MKTIKIYVPLSFILGLIFTSCQTKTQAPKVKEAEPEVAIIEEISPKLTDVNAVFKSQITEVYQAYNQLKDALVASDSALAVIGANAVLTNLNKVDMGLLTQAEAHQVWMNEKPLLTKALNELVKSTALESQRALFLQISNNMINLIENFGTSEKVMVQFCPMADDFKGGFWLSKDPAIKNPYFGSKMMTCGSTKKIVNP